MDYIDSHVLLTSGAPSPEIFRLWAAIACVGGALERRVWVQTAQAPLYPNLFTLLIAPPAVGKSQALSPIHKNWMETKKLKVSPDNMTKASLIDTLAAASNHKMVGGMLREQHPLLICQGELGVLLPAHDLEFLSVVNHLFDSPNSYRETRRTMNRDIDIVNPQLSILAGTQPKFLAETMPEAAWGMGFFSRVIMVYAGTSPQVDLFDAPDIDSGLKAQLAKQLLKICDMMGPASFSPEAKDAFRNWYRGGMQPTPDHTKLEHYRGRRALHMLKLCTIATASRVSGEPHHPSGGLTITLDDYQRALSWLLEAESRMPDVFRDMAGKSDMAVMQEMHFWMWQTFTLDPQKKGQFLPERFLVAFLSQRVPSDKIGKIIEIAERAGLIIREAGTGGQGKPTMYKPTPKSSHGLE